jgi:hypothetical protein
LGSAADVLDPPLPPPHAQASSASASAKLIVMQRRALDMTAGNTELLLDIVCAVLRNDLAAFCTLKRRPAHKVSGQH